MTMPTATAISFTEATDFLHHFMGDTYKTHSLIKDGWTSDAKIVGINVSASSVIRKPTTISNLKMFIKGSELPLRIVDKNKYSASFQIYYNEQ